MAYTLEQLSADCHAAMAADNGPAGREKVRDYISVACGDSAFVAEHFENPGQEERQLLYEDPEFNFCILAHSYNGAKGSNPHDHGPSWAIYGQAKGQTEMTDWQIVDKDKHSVYVVPEKTYLMKPGDVHFYDVGDVHSPIRKDPVRLLRVEGENLDKVQRSKIIEK